MHALSVTVYLHNDGRNTMNQLASLRTDLKIVDSEIANPPAYIRDINDLHRVRRSLVRKIAKLEANLAA